MHTFALIFSCWAFASQGRRSSTENVAKIPSSLRLERGSVRPSNSLRRLFLTLNYVLPLPGGRSVAGGKRSFPIASLQPSSEKRSSAHSTATPERGQPGYKRSVLKRVIQRLLQRGHMDATRAVIESAVLEDSTHFDGNRSSESEQLVHTIEENPHSAASGVIANAPSAASPAIGHNSSSELLDEMGIDVASHKAEDNLPAKTDVVSRSTTVVSTSTRKIEQIAVSTSTIAVSTSTTAVSTSTTAVSTSTPPLVAEEVSRDNELALDVSGSNLSLRTSRQTAEIEGGSADAQAQPFSGESYGSKRRITFSEFGSFGQLPPLPSLSPDEERRLQSGEYVRWQEPSIRAGSRGCGFSVVELHANADDVWRAVRDFDGYRERISTVKTVTHHADTPGGFPRYSFLVSRIRLALNVRFHIDDKNKYAAWQLDRRSWVLCDSDGYWRVQPCEDRPGVVRVWFVVGVQLANFVPNFVIQLVSRLGLDKATRWLKSLEVELS